MRFILLFLVFTINILYADLYRIDDSGVHLLSPSQQSGGGTPDSLLMNPNIYGFNGPSYDCNAEGLYKYYVVNTNYANRLVYNGNIPKLINSITWLHAQGYHDDTVSYSTALTIAKTRRLRMTCGSIVQFANTLCSNLSVNNRFILLLTLDSWNTYNNGHSLLEVNDGVGWKLWDIDLRNYFQQGSLDLNAIEFRDAVSVNDYDIVHFSQSPILAFGDLIYSSYDYSNWYETQFIDEVYLRQFYSRCAQIVLIKSGSNFYFTSNSSDRIRIESYDPSFIYMSEVDFMNTFYP